MDTSDLLISPEKYVLVKNEEQVLDAYGNLFEKMHIDILPFYIEKKFNAILKTNSPRFIITPSGIVGVTSERGDKIWNMNFETPEGKLLLEKLNQCSAQVKSKDIDDLTQTLSIENQNYYLKLLPYNDSDASKVLVDELDQKYNAYKNEQSLRNE